MHKCANYTVKSNSGETFNSCNVHVAGGCGWNVNNCINCPDFKEYHEAGIQIRTGSTIVQIVNYNGDIEISSRNHVSDRFQCLMPAIKEGEFGYLTVHDQCFVCHVIVDDPKYGEIHIIYGDESRDRSLQYHESLGLQIKKLNRVHLVKPGKYCGLVEEGK